MREFQINKNDSGQRVDKFLTKLLPKLPQSLMYKSIRNKKIKVNRRRCEISQRLEEGDTMQLFLAEEFFEMDTDMRFLQADPHLDILYEDAHILLVDKPAGMLAHSDDAAFTDNLIDRIKHYLYRKKEYRPQEENVFSPALCHRIDRNTQGIVIAAKDAASLRLINEKIRSRQLDKYYVCAVEGHMPKRKDTVVLYHAKDHRKNQARLADRCREGYKKIQTGYRVLHRGTINDLLEVELFSGKSHQIRAVMAYLGHPLLSDVKYGARRERGNHQALCAYKIRFHFAQGEELAYLDGKAFALDDEKIKKVFAARDID